MPDRFRAASATLQQSAVRNIHMSDKSTQSGHNSLRIVRQPRQLRRRSARQDMSFHLGHTGCCYSPLKVTPLSPLHNTGEYPARCTSIGDALRLARRGQSVAIKFKPLHGRRSPGSPRPFRCGNTSLFRRICLLGKTRIFSTTAGGSGLPRQRIREGIAQEPVWAISARMAPARDRLPG